MFKNNSPYVISEIGLNHNGQLDLALRSIELSVAAGASAVKFQTFNSNLFLSPNNFDIKERQSYELTKSDWHTLRQFASDLSVDFISTPLDYQSLDLLIGLKPSALKVASCDLNNLPFLQAIAKSGLPIIFSTGYSNFSEVVAASEIIRRECTQVKVVMHCVSSYPTDIADANLSNITLLKNSLPDFVVGFSDHTLDTSVIPSVAVSLGARVFEKHFTLDRDLPGYDHKMSLDPDAFRAYVNSIGLAYSSIGQPRTITNTLPVETLRKKSARRSLFWAKSLSKGHLIVQTDLLALRPGDGIPPTYLPAIIGNTLSSSVIEGEPFQLGHLSCL